MTRLFSPRSNWRFLAAVLLIGLASCRASVNDPATGQSARKGMQAEIELDARSTEPPDAKPIDPSDAFFDEGRIPQIRIELKEPQEKTLREDLRRYVKCTVVETLPNPDAPSTSSETTYTEVAIKLKGAAGSFQELDGKPAFTLNMHKHVKEQTFHGLDKFHLNNSVQDESYLSEWICADICRAAKVPATRVTQARVWLNGRDLGLYVLKEGFDEPFLKRHFGDATGNLYDGGFLQDVDVDLEKDSGRGPDDHGDLHALKAACEEPDAALRWPAIERQLDVDAFLTFMAFERMTCHWDGYTPNKNNYRIYFDPKDGRARFLPHGMDQIFQDPGFPILEFPPTIVSSAVMHNPEWRKRYRERISELLPLFEAKRLHDKLDVAMARLKSVVNALGDDFAKNHADRVRELKERIAAREPALREQLEHGDPTPIEFDAHNQVEIADWYGAQETGDTLLDEVDPETDRRYSIQVGESGDCVASWRRRVLLARGRYRIEVRLKTEGVEPRTDEQGTGAGVRISGGKRDNKVVGDTDWQTVSHDFEVTDEMRDVELVAELRATKGRLWLKPTARLIRIEPK
ncbi:MAG: CotH kinase family protein [Planctomycetota bacterium]